MARQGRDDLCESAARKTDDSTHFDAAKKLAVSQITAPSRKVGEKQKTSKDDLTTDEQKRAFNKLMREWSQIPGRKFDVNGGNRKRLFPI